MVWLSIALAAASYALVVYCQGQRVSPDGYAYLSMARGERRPLPFHLRWLLPAVLRTNQRAWVVASCASLIAAAWCVWAFAGASGLSPQRALFAVVLFVGLPLFRTTAHLPVLVDAPALAAMAGSAALAVSGHPYLAVVVACAGATCKEHVPVFAALAAWSPWPLLGLAAPLLRMLWKRGAAEHPNTKHPMQYARGKQGPRLLNPYHVLLPWGACLAALWAAPSLALVLSVAAAYGMLFVAADSTRVYQWAFLPVCVAAAGVVPEPLLIPLAVAHLWNPFRGEI